MTKIISKVIFIFFLLSNPNFILSKCTCQEKEIRKIESIIHFNNLKVCKFTKTLSEFQLSIQRDKLLLNEWENCLNEFESYINSLNKQNKVITVEYRLLRWLHIIKKKIIGFKRNLNKKLKQIIFEFELTNLDENLNCLLNLQPKSLNIDVTSKNLSNQIVQKITESKDLFYTIKNEIIELIESSIQFRAKLNNLINSEKFTNCCCWY